MAAYAVNNLRRNTRGGGRIITQIWSAEAANFRRSGHTSSGYEKNVEEQVVVPDEVIEASARQAADNKYWAPHPYTGVFGPAATAADVVTDNIPNKLEDQQLQMNVDDESSEKAWFRPTSLEDLEKPPSHQ